MKKEKSVINFNKSLNDLPTFTPPNNGPQIVFNAAKRPIRIARYLYHVQAFKPVDDAAEPYRDGKISLIVTCPLKFRNEFDDDNKVCCGKDYLYHRLDYQKYWSGTNNSRYIDVQEW